MLVDSHCHLDMLDLTLHDGTLNTVIENARQNQVAYMLCVCVNFENLTELLHIAANYVNVYASVGLHPTEHPGKVAYPDIDELVALADKPNVVAIGETGLDYFHCAGDLDWQRDRFRRHLAASKLTQKPVIVHSRNARKDTIAILREAEHSSVEGVMHCFAEDWDMAKQALDLGFYISFSGIVTFKNAREIQEVAKKVPLDRMLIETDSPYLAPVPFRGKPNQPAYVRHVAECIAELRGDSYADIARVTTQNFFELFKHATHHPHAWREQSG